MRYLVYLILALAVTACGGGGSGSSGSGGSQLQAQPNLSYGNGLEGIWVGAVGDRSYELVVLANNQAWMLSRRSSASYQMAGRTFAGISQDDQIYTGTLSKTANTFDVTGWVYGYQAGAQPGPFRLQGSYTASRTLTATLNSGLEIVMSFEWPPLENLNPSLEGVYNSHHVFNNGPWGGLIGVTQVDGVRISATGTSTTPYDSCHVDGALTLPTFYNSIYQFSATFRSEPACSQVQGQGLVGIAYRRPYLNQIRELALISNYNGIYINILTK